MAESVLKAQDSFRCAVCLELLKKPVTIPCGHSYCLDCIKGCWDQEDQRGVYSCPQCRQSFTPRPVLNKNTMLAELAEGLRKTRLQAAPADDSYAKPGDVECDACTGTKHKAVKSCQTCVFSYCETHLQSHYESPAFRNHKLTEPSMNLKETICSNHKKLLEIFCRTDEKFICYLCAMHEHSGHKTVSTAAERSDKQKHLMETQKESKRKIDQKEKTIKDLRQAVDSLRRSAQTAVENSEKIFAEMLLSIKRIRSEVKEQIRTHEQVQLSLAEEIQKKLEQEIDDLKTRAIEMEQISHTEDHVHFLKSYHLFSASPLPSSDLPSITLNPHFSIEKLMKAASDIQEQLKKLRPSEVIKISGDSHQTQQDKKKPYKHFLKWNIKQKVQVLTRAQSAPEKGDIVSTLMQPEAEEHEDATSESLFAEAMYDYEAADETEISLNVGDLITGIEMTDEGWWHGYGPDGNFGMFPANYVALI